jgi:virulence factor Mce-like protein
VRRLIALGVVLLVVVAAAVTMGAGGSTGSKRTYKLEFDNAFGLTKGGDFKIAGVRAGKTTKFDLAGGSEPKAVVTAELTEPGIAGLHKDAHCEIRPQSLIGEYFVDCDPGDSRERLPSNGGVLPVSRTTSTIPIDLVNNILRRPYRERLRLIIAELGAGLAGRPADLSEALRRAHPGLRETSKVLQILGRQTSTIERFIQDADTTVAALAARKRDVSRFVREAGETAAVSATRREHLRRTFNRLPVFLGELRPYMARLSKLTVAQTPLLRNLRGSATDLDRFLRLLRPFARSSRPAFRGLGEASVAGTRAVRATTGEIRELRRLSVDAPPVAKPLRQFLETLDDRRRAAENDPRAATSGPPAPDKTHIPAGSAGGFTGMEALWDFFYWQALSTNGLDDVGHILRLAVIVDPQCSQYQVNVDASTQRCVQWLGPHQPGVNAPDPTKTAAATASTAAPQRTRGGGSSADTKLPTASTIVQQLLGGAAAPQGAPPTTDARRPTTDPTGSLLDYLMSP